MRDDAEHPVKHPDDEEPRVINAGLPSWFRAMIYVAGGLITGLGIAEARFVSRIEYQGHQDAQRQDIERLLRVQAEYALAERQTSQSLGEISERLTTMEADLGWVRQYLDLSKPPPPRRPNGVGTHR